MQPVGNGAVAPSEIFKNSLKSSKTFSQSFYPPKMSADCDPGFKWCCSNSACCSRTVFPDLFWPAPPFL